MLSVYHCRLGPSLLLQKDIREEHVNNFLAPLYMSDIMPNPDEKRLACATHLHKRFKFTGGVEEAKTKLDTVFLTPKVRKKDEEQQYRPEKLYKVLRQAWPRFQRDLEQVMVPAFMVQAGQWLKIGSRGRVNGRNNMPIFSRDEARKTIRAYWMFNTAMGRNSVLAGLHAGFQRLQGIGVVLVDATATTDRHYKVTFKTYAALLAMVRCFSCFISLACTVWILLRGRPSAGNQQRIFLSVRPSLTHRVPCAAMGPSCVRMVVHPGSVDHLQMYIAMHKMAKYDSFTQRGGNVDQAFRKVWASCMLLLDDQLNKDTGVHEGLLLTDGDDVARSVFPGLLPSRLLRTMELMSRATRPPSPPATPAAAAAAAAFAAAADAVSDGSSDEDDEDDDDDDDDVEDGEEGA